MTHGIPEAAAILILGIPAGVNAFVSDAPIPMPEWVGNASQISAFGLVAWIVYYMFSRWLPEIQKQHAQQVKEQLEAHTKTIETLAAGHRDALAQMTKTFSDNLNQQRGDLLILSKQIIRDSEKLKEHQDHQ